MKAKKLEEPLRNASTEGEEGDVGARRASSASTEEHKQEQEQQPELGELRPSSSPLLPEDPARRLVQKSPKIPLSALLVGLAVLLALFFGHPTHIYTLKLSTFTRT